MTSRRPRRKAASIDFSDERLMAAYDEEPQRGQSDVADSEHLALGSSSRALMDRVVAWDNLQKAWKRVRTNGGAPGPDGITTAEFPEYFHRVGPTVIRQLRSGTYQPGPARRKTIDKPDGGHRNLGIPNVMDRMIQQAILQILTPMFDPEFSESSFGYRPKRSAHGAIKQIKRIIQAGYRHCVDMDLSKYFDTIQHDVLMSRVSRKVDDKRLLKLLGRFLRAGLMVDNQFQPTDEGTMQGGPLSPLLANILLDDFDKELERRGLKFVRYADDFLVFTKTAIAAKRVFVSVEKYLRQRLKLQVNEQKSRVCSSQEVEFLSYRFHSYGGQLRISPKKLRKFRQRARELLNRNHSKSLAIRLTELNRYLRGWMGYFVLDTRKTLFDELDMWLRRRVRACIWKQWRKPRTRVRKLRQMGVNTKDAHSYGHSSKGPWRMSRTRAVAQALNNRWLTGQGMLSLSQLWSQLAPLRRTA